MVALLFFLLRFPGSGGLFREEGLKGSVAAHPRGDWCVQQVACKEDRAFSRDLLKRRNASSERAPGEMLDLAVPGDAFFAANACSGIR
jgi:hypothetical protein